MARIFVVNFKILIAFSATFFLASRDVAHCSDISKSFFQNEANDLDAGCLHIFTHDDYASDFTFTLEQEKLFLLELYKATGGRDWYNNSGWQNDVNTDHCNWYGIQCYEISGYIKSIDLTANLVKNTPPNFWRFRNLQGLCLSQNNKMTGKISDILSSNMTRLRRVSLSYTGVKREIPWKLIMQFSDLEILQLCCMTGKRFYKNDLPANLGSLRKLQVLSIGRNQISKVHLPQSIRNATNLWFLDLEDIQLKSGNLTYFNNMKHLKYLNIKNCRLKGIVPKDFGLTHPEMIELDMFGNRLKGDISSCFFGFKNIERISLGSNKRLTGIIPNIFGEFGVLKELDLSGNNFTGLDANFMFGKQFQSLYIDQNVNLNVRVENFISAFRHCHEKLRLVVARNAGLKGHLWLPTMKFPNAMYIDLSTNVLTGELPSLVASDLLYLNLSNNNFTEFSSRNFFASLKTLKYLDLRGNPYLFQDKPVDKWMDLEPSFHDTVQYSTYRCPTFFFKKTRGEVYLDPAFYNYSQCICKDDHYGFKNFCMPCMPGGSCSNSDNLEISSTNDRYVNMTIKKGYWPYSGNYTNVTRLINCKNHKHEFDDEVCNPSGNCQCGLQIVNNQPQTNCNTSCLCRYGNKGRFCSRCIKGYIKRGAICIPCPHFQIIALVLSILVAIATVFLFKYKRKWRKHLLALAFSLVAVLVVLQWLKIIRESVLVIVCAVWIWALVFFNLNGSEGFRYIAVFYFQSLNAMFDYANVWPQEIVFIKYKIKTIFSPDWTEFTCEFSKRDIPTELDFVLTLSIPVGLVFLIWLVFLVKTQIAKKWVILRTQSLNYKSATIQVILFFYFPIGTKTIDASLLFEHRYELSYLKATPWLEYNGFSFNYFRFFGYSSIIVIVVLVPIVLFCLYVRYIDDNDNVDNKTWLKPLHKMLTPKCRRYFPFFHFVRPLLLAIPLSVLEKSSVQGVVVTAALLIFIIITSLYRPYKKYSDKFDFETLADVVVCSVLLLSFVGVDEVPRRIVAKAILKVVGKDVQEAAGPLQACAGHEAGCEAAIHGYSC
ncbi:putative leucine-rich repeat-containing protein DDB_G0281931 [Xenia sp. Carnegie-2017]|uniref:putative leucine-rich repeat-containing protein DDB_G0281931 n=1 Tax=Xenia sp. Carnegie-2017 TaxID=2897299 RepID=UPI001F042C98|nr:putative leucine-rich repeat-containing protein DDB_G0281931 [Xenia sp. Carnegie-2017]